MSKERTNGLKERDNHRELISVTSEDHYESIEKTRDEM